MHQNRRIADARRAADDVARSSKDHGDRIDILVADVDRLMLINRALSEILQKFHPVDDTQLLAKIREIELRDGKLDRKLTSSPQRCASCGNVLNTRHLR